jgi:DNA-binding NtrC family response regulator
MTLTSLFEEVEQPTKKRLRVVLASSDFKSQEALIRLLQQRGLEPIPSSSLEETKFLLAQTDAALVICHATSGDGAFREVLRLAARNGSKVPVIVCTDFYEPHLYLEAMELGAFDYIAYPYYRDGVEWVVGNALNQVANTGRNSYKAERAEYESVSC